MEDEHSALLRSGTWTLMPPPGRSVIGYWWVFKIKHKVDGSMGKFMAQGFTQRYGVDYLDTYSPVVKPATVPVVLAISMSRNWCVKQLDNAFLCEVLDVTAYI